MSDLGWWYLWFGFCYFLAQGYVRRNWVKKRDAMDYWMYFCQAIVWPVYLFVLLHHATRFYERDFLEWMRRSSKP